MSTCHRWIESPVGRLLLVGDDAGLRRVAFVGGPTPPHAEPGWEAGGALVDEAARQLGSYFAGRLRRFDLPLAPEGTPFQRKVWAALGEIPYGETVSYGELARRLGHPNASRAVGLANGANPIAIIIPCHRVVGAGGRLTGYGGGLANKRWLLDFERGQGSICPPETGGWRPGARP